MKMDKTNRNKDAVTQRILETTQETERLKQELQNLIAAGISGNKNYNLPTSKTNISLESTNKVQIIKSYDPKHSQHIKKPSESLGNTIDPSGSKTEIQALSPKKPKGYDVHQAREYIKKQRDKRKEEIKSKKSESQIIAEIRKEKLQELQQKASELVKKNVEAKRHRSKSRERTSVLPTNESVIVGFNCAEKTKKHLEEPVVSQIKPQRSARDLNFLCPPEPSFNLGGKSSEPIKYSKSSRNVTSIRGITGNKHSKSLQNLLRPPEPHYQKEYLEVRSNKSSENLSKNITPKEQQRIVQSKVTLRPTNSVTSIATDHQSDSKYASSKSALHTSTESSSKRQSAIKRTVTGQSQVTLESTDEDHPLINDQAGLKDATSEPLSDKPVNNYLIKKSPSKKIEVLSNITLKHADDFPCQVKNRNEKIATPEWLKESVGQGDPYNFINTVKRQLKYVVNEKKPFFVDVGIQGNLEEDISEPNTGNISKKSDLKSFISHKCLNLDPHTIQHIELNRKRSKFEYKDGPTITNPSMGSDYDSDTSKNIPSLSSESGTSLRRNAEFVKQSYALSNLKPLVNAPPNLDTKKVDDIKLKKTSKLSNSEISTQKTSNRISSLKLPLQEDVERIKKQLFITDSDCYSSDFIPTDLSKSRDSLISFNCAKVSPNRVPDHYKIKSETLVSPTMKSNNNVSAETGTISKRSLSSQTSENNVQEPRRKSSSLNSVSQEGSQKRNSRSAQFYSLHSELHPSTTDAEFKLADHNVGHMEISEISSSEVGTGTSGKNGWKSDGSTEVLKSKDIFLDLNNPQETLSNDFSENTKTSSSLKESEKSATELYKSRSEKIVSNKRNTGVFSKSESNIYEDKENLKGMSLKEPKLSLNVKEKNRRGMDESSRQALMKNISIRSQDRTIGDTNKNEIHLKFEAEIHLLNDFNQSLKHFSEIEKAFESLRWRNDSEILTKKVLQSRDTQTSIITKTVSKQSDTSNSQISTINYSRGSGIQSPIDSEIHTDGEDNTQMSKRSDIKPNAQDNNSEDLHRLEHRSEILLDLTQGSDLNTVLNSVNLEETELGNISERSSIIHISQVDDMLVRGGDFMDENSAIRNFAGMSLRMFDQLIKDEDARIENWKKIVKIREQALLDRTRGELVYLEMQKKQLIETGKMPEASLIKKKQRGILLKHQQEKHEMQRLKQMQKEASAKRKTLLKREKNLIKNQLLSGNMLSKLKSSSHREKNERRLSGPLKVIQATGSVHPETSLSKGVGGTDQEIKNITSRTCSMVLSATSDNLIADIEPLDLTLARNKNINAAAVSSMKKRLLMREHALAKRRKTVEELLQWHKKLLEEEKAIEDLESKVEKIISKIPSESNEEPSKQPQDLSKSISERTLSEVNTPSMSQVVLDRLLPSKETISVKTKSISSETSKNIPQEDNVSEDSNKVVSSANYSTDFDVDSVPEVLPQNSDDQSNVSSLSQLIENFSKIEDNILNLSLVQKRQSLESEEVSSVKSEGAKTISSDAENIDQDEEKSETSSHSNQISSEVEIKLQEESPSELIQSETKQDPVEDSVASVIIEEPSHLVTADSEENKLISPVDIEEIKEESAKEESEEIGSVNLRTGKNHVPKALLIFEELSKEPQSVVISEELENASVSEEVEDTSVPDDSHKISLDVANKIAEEISTSIISKLSQNKRADETNISEEISFETNREEESPMIRSTAEQSRKDEIQEDDSQLIITENKLENYSIDSAKASSKSIEDIQKTSQDIDIAVEVSSEKTSVHEESKPSTSHKESAESSHLLSCKKENIPSNHKFLDTESQDITAQILSEALAASVSKDDVSTSQQYEEIDEYEASNVDIPSTSRQTEDQATTSQILSLSKDDVTIPIEEQEPHGHLSNSTSSIPENDIQSPSVIEEERQLFENKTDEEKVASLSIRSSVNHSGSVSDERNRSSSITRPSSLAIQEPSVSGARSLSTSKDSARFLEDVQGSVVSDKSILGETSAVSTSGEQRISEVSVSERRSKYSDGRDAEKSLKEFSKESGGSRIDSVEEKLSETSHVQEKSLPTDDKLKESASGSKAEISVSSGALKVASTSGDASSVHEKACSIEEKSTDVSSKGDKSVEVEENQSEASPLQDISGSASQSSSTDEKSSPSVAISATTSQKSVSSEIPSNSTVSKEKSDIYPQKLSITPEKSPRPSLDVKKRVQEILNEASPVSRGDKSPRMQDLCVMTYDLISPTRSPESGSPLEEKTKSFSLGSEAEELLKKQLAIEHEIKLLTEQQQKDQAPQFYIREIPNKPPPPYTPPSKAKAPKTPSIIPSSKEEVEQITEYSAKIIHKAYLSNNLDNISISDNTLNLIAKNIDKGCYKYVFDLCKEVAIDHYSQFTTEAGPSWLQLQKKIVLAPTKPLDVKGLKKLMYKKLLELFGFEKQEKKKENAIMKWSRKKRDHVDEVLVQEMQAEETSWTNFDRDELIVKDRITNEIMEMLLKETAQVLKKTVQKKSFSQ